MVETHVDRSKEAYDTCDKKHIVIRIKGSSCELPKYNTKVVAPSLLTDCSPSSNKILICILSIRVTTFDEPLLRALLNA